MDDELQGKSAQSRTLDSVTDTHESRQLAENAHVLHNLLQSLEASAGTPGPVSTMLPDFQSTLSSDQVLSDEST